MILNGPSGHVGLLSPSGPAARWPIGPMARRPGGLYSPPLVTVFLCFPLSTVSVSMYLDNNTISVSFIDIFVVMAYAVNRKVIVNAP